MYSKAIMIWLTDRIIALSPLALIVIILVAMALGWTLYALRGYYYWLNRFQRYPVSGKVNKLSRARNRYYYSQVEYPRDLFFPRRKKIQDRYPAAPLTPRQSIGESRGSIAAPTTAFDTISQTNHPTLSTKDDLQVIEGIGSRIEEVLNNNGIYTWRELAQTSVKDLNIILEKAGLSNHDPKTWPKQAHMAEKGYWNELKEYQDILFGGRE